MKITIVGGGITGLASAYIAAKKGHKVKVLEASKTFGGLLNTFEIEGNRLEYYYHHFFTHDAEINWLIKELGISDKLIFQKTTMGVYRKGKIYDFNSPFDLFKFKPIKFIDKFLFGLSSLYLGRFTSWQDKENTPAIDWFYKYAGKTSTDSLWKPMLDIKFGPYANKVPLAWMVGRLRQRLGSRKSGDERLGYLKGSLNTLLQALLSKLKELNVELISNTPLTDLMLDGNKITGIKSGDIEYKSDKTLITIPGLYIADILKDKIPNLSNQYKDIKYFGAVCVILKMKKKLSDIYWLNVADEGFPFGGVIEHTNFIDKSEYGGLNIAYLSRYFAHEEDIARMSNDEIEKLMIPHLKKIYPNFSESDLEEVFVFKTNTAATVCDLDFSKRIPACETSTKGLYVCNMAHIYPDERSVNNSIRIAAEACKKMGIDSEFVPKGVSLSGQLGF